MIVTLLILRNHGLVTWGRTVAEAFYLMYMVQHACEIQIAAQAGGVTLTMPDDDINERVSAESRNAGENLDHYDLAFHSLVRRLDKLDTEWRG